MTKRTLWAAFIAALAVALVQAGPAAASFPGSNGKLLYSANDEAGNFWIATSPPPYTTSTTIASGGSLEPSGAIWSANGHSIAFASNSGAIWLMNALGGNQHQIIPAPQNNGALVPTGFSPDGRVLLYTKVAGSTPRTIWEANVNGTGRHAVATPPANAQDGDARFSPNGALIVFDRDTCTPSTCRSQIYRMRADGTQQINLSHNSQRDSQPDWSPDATKIVFNRFINKGQHFQVFTMNANGSSQVNISRDNPSEGSPTWSPDGRWIVFNRFASIYRMHPDGSAKTLLVRGGNGFEADQPSFQPIPH